jgi:hypothetical protein
MPFEYFPLILEKMNIYDIEQKEEEWYYLEKRIFARTVRRKQL